MSYEEWSDDEPWTLKKVREKTDTWMRGLGIPQMTRPEGLGKEYTFPDNAATLTNLQLGDIGLKLAAYYSYFTQLLGKEASDKSRFERTYLHKLNLAIVDERKQYAKNAPTRDELESLAIDHSSELKKLWKTLMWWESKVEDMKAQLLQWEKQLAQLSREQSRRTDELRATSRFG